MSEQQPPFPGGGMPDLGSLLEQAQNLMAARAEASEQLVEGQAGGGVVKVQATAGGDFKRVTIDPKVVDPSDVEMLQDLVLAAIRDAVSRAEQINESAMGDLGGLGGLLGPG
jgi:DNA-binding YbaB/EbfC family protein